MKIWDYLMRRKPLLVFLLVIFGVSGCLTSAIVSRRADKTVGTTSTVPEQAPSTVSEVTTEPSLPSSELIESNPEPLSRVHVYIANPEEVASNMASYADGNSTSPDPTVAQDENIEIPRTNRSPYVVWYNIVTSTTLALVMAFICIAAARLITSFRITKR